VDAEAGEGVEVDGQGGDEGFAFTGLHFRDHAAVQGDAADELDVEVDHFPEDRVVVDGDGGAAHPAGGVFDDGVGLGQDLFEVFGAGFRKRGSLRGRRPWRLRSIPGWGGPARAGRETRSRSGARRASRARRWPRVRPRHALDDGFRGASRVVVAGEVACQLRVISRSFSSGSRCSASSISLMRATVGRMRRTSRWFLLPTIFWRIHLIMREMG
jgi:hypothetical protein